MSGALGAQIEETDMTESSAIRPDAIDLPPTVPIDVLSWMRENQE